MLQAAAQRRKIRDKKYYSLTVRWTAGHSGILGNEEVDTEAKKAAEMLTNAIGLPLSNTQKMDEDRQIRSTATPEEEKPKVEVRVGVLVKTR